MNIFHEFVEASVLLKVLRYYKVSRTGHFRNVVPFFTKCTNPFVQMTINEGVFQRGEEHASDPTHVLEVTRGPLPSRGGE